MLRGMISWALWVCVFWGVGAAVGQVTTGTISGTVSDSTGAVAPGATITVKNTDTGISRTVTTDAAGRYSALQLGPGNYEVTAAAAGFQTVVRSGITLTVGREAAVNFSLQVGPVAEHINVTGEAPLIETTSSSVSGLVSATQMKDLPLNARSYEQLALLQPNVYYQRNVFPTTNTGYTPKISAAGMRTSYNAFVVDGIDISDTTGQSPGSAAGQLMGVETLREFRVLTNNYKAEYGRAIGAVVDVVSRGGTNELHGTVFEFLRNDKVDARNFFDPGKPPFRRNQFGAVVGGPMVRDTAFFFGSYEALRQRLTTTSVVFVPTGQAKQGILPDPRNPSATITIPVHPEMKPYLSYYPSSQQDIGGGFGLYRFPFKGSIREDFVTGRMDYQYSPSVSYFVRYSGDSTDKIQQVAPTVLPLWAEGLTSWNQTATLAETRIFTAQLINEFRFGFVRYTPRNRNHLNGPDPQLQFPETVGQAIISARTGGVGTFTGVQLADVGSAGGRPFENITGNTFQAVDNISYIVGAHSLKMGFNIERFQDNVENRTDSGLYRDKSTYLFQSLEDLLRGNAFSFSGPLSPSPIGISGRQWLFGFYIQDDYRWRPNFTLNLGLRHEFASNYSNVHNRFIVLNDLFGTPKTGQEHGWQGRVCAGCIDPRFGFAWDLFSNGKTALKGGFGVFRSQLVRFQGYYQIPRESPGGINLSVDNPSFPNPTVPNPNSRIILSASGTGEGGVKIIPRVPSTPSALHWNLTLQQQVTPKLAVQIAYLGSHGYHLDGGYVVNTNTYEILPDGDFFFPPGIHRIRPDYGATAYAAYDFNSYYNGITITVGQKMSHGLALEASYVFSRSTDDTSITHAAGAHNTAGTKLADGNRKRWHALSDLDMRQRGVINFTYEFPSVTWQNVFANKLLSGWQLNSIITLQGGLPLTPLVGFDRANSRGESPSTSQPASLNPSQKGPIPTCPCTLPALLGGGKQASPERYFDPTVFVLPPAGRYGNAGRNIFVGAGLVNFDFALVKNIAITERLNLQFRAEGYNMFNNVNWSQPNNRIFETNGGISATAGRITSTSTTGRQFQFALKLLF